MSKGGSFASRGVLAVGAGAPSGAGVRGRVCLFEKGGTGRVGADCLVGGMGRHDHGGVGLCY